MKIFKKTIIKLFATFIILFFLANNILANPVKETASSLAAMVTAIPKGAYAGMGRGITNHRRAISKNISNKIGFGFFGKTMGLLVGAPIGLVTGSLAGAASGTIKGTAKSAKIAAQDTVIRTAAVSAASSI